MGVAIKLRWKQVINQLRYLYEENDVVQTISQEAAVDFQLYYEEYCARHDIDIRELTRQNAERLKDLFGDGAVVVPEEDDEPEAAHLGALVLRDMDQPDVEIDEHSEMSQPEQELHNSFRKVFLKLALVLHPDKIDPSSSPEVQKNTARKFQEVKDAFEKRKYFILLDYAEQYNISVPKNYKQQIKWMKKEIFQIEKEIGTAKSTYNYGFAECDSDEERDRLIEGFMGQVFGANFAKKG